MICPLYKAALLAKPARDVFAQIEAGDARCDGGVCALWEANTGTCGLMTQAYLAGVAVARKEIKERG